eukprot:5740821-Ditylum_brightwellii.AAC.1
MAKHGIDGERFMMNNKEWKSLQLSLFPSEWQSIQLPFLSTQMIFPTMHRDAALKEEPMMHVLACIIRKAPSVEIWWRRLLHHFHHSISPVHGCAIK